MDGLPEDLPPAQRAAIDALLAEVNLTTHREHRRDKDRPPTRCQQCYQTGRLVEVDRPTGGTAFVHKRCIGKVRS